MCSRLECSHCLYARLRFELRGCSAFLNIFLLPTVRLDKPAGLPAFDKLLIVSAAAGSDHSDFCLFESFSDCRRGSFHSDSLLTVSENALAVLSGHNLLHEVVFLSRVSVVTVQGGVAARTCHNSRLSILLLA